MKKIALFSLAIFILPACKENKAVNDMANSKLSCTSFEMGYSEVNGLSMYYEIYGEGNPLVLIHGGGSTIQTSFGRVIPLLCQNRKLIAVELQAHGRTNDRDSDLSFEQDANDVVTLLKNLGIEKADFFGFSNGGTTALQISIRHPEVVDKLILGSTLSKRNGVPSIFWGFMEHARIEIMPEQLKRAYLEVTPDTTGLQKMHDKDAKRMIHFEDIPDEMLRSIKSPTLIIVGDQDVITQEHAREMNHLIPKSELLIIPGRHGEYIGEITTLKPGFSEKDLIVIPIIENFLKEGH